ncbi:MAG: SpaH/EbpB family LPXTG-anchored major pilin [Ruminococcus sp.]|nr:SpaH/EbpB family LPXTG-anchored major pilin [Ruminococcus sp.]
MNNIKKITSLVLALVIAFALYSVAFAAETGSITIKNTTKGQQYSVYQIFTLESYDKTTGKYSYKVSNGAVDSFKAEPFSDYVDVDANNYVTWKDGADQDEFAKLLRTSITLFGATPVATKTSTADGADVVFDNLELGYYGVNSTMGSVAELTTTNPNVEIVDKNDKPTLEKYILNLNATDYADFMVKQNTVSIADNVVYCSIVSAKVGGENYKVHDVMESGLTMVNLDEDIPLAVAKIGKTDDGEYDFGSIDSTTDALTLGTDYTISKSCTDGCTFEILFTKTYLDSLTADQNLAIIYTAYLNANAEIAPASNDNTSWMEYGNKIDADGDPSTPDEFPKTPDEITKTYTYKFDLVKTDASNKVITGAKFKLYDAATEGNEIPLLKISDGLYRPAGDGETAAEIEAGNVTVIGLKGDTVYYLQETKQPDGYSLLKNRVSVPIINENLTATVTEGTWVSGGIQVINKSGSLLPETGGIGTAIFYTCGGLLVLLAAVLFITKRRSSNEK